MWRTVGADGTNASSGRGADRATWLQAISSLKEAGFSHLTTSKEVVIDALVATRGIVIPNQALSSEDYSNMVSAIVNTISPTDMSLARQGCDVMDGILRSAEVTFNARKVDTVLEWLVKVVSTDHTASRSNGSVPSHAVADLLERRSLAACALRCIGCVVYENADRCSRWYDPLVRVFVQVIVPPAPISILPAQPVDATMAHGSLAQGSASASLPASTVAGLDATPSSLTFIAAADDSLSAALVAAGNLLLKAGTKVRDKHVLLFPPILRVLVWGATLPARSLPAVEHAGRVLSAALRALQAILQSGQSHTAPTQSLASGASSAVPTVQGPSTGLGSADRKAVTEAVQRSSEDLLRVLHKLSTFGWDCEAIRPSAAPAGSQSARAKGKRDSSAPPASAEGAQADVTDSAPTSARRRSSGPLLAAGSPRDGPGGEEAGVSTSQGTRTPERHSARRRANSAIPAEREDDAASLTDDARSTRSGRSGHSMDRAAKWRSSTESGKAGAAHGQAAGGRSGQSWYADSDDEDEFDEHYYSGGGGAHGGLGADGGGSDAASQSQGMTFGLGGGGGGAARRKRVPLRVRVTALHCIIAIARAQPRLVHSRWSLFLPQVEGTNPRPFSPTLLTVLLHDPSRRVREAAATTLAAVVDNAPLSRWIALPERHDAAVALASQGSGVSPNGRTTGGVGTGSAPAGTTKGLQAGAARLAGNRTVASLSDKTCAMLCEVHAGLRLALSVADVNRQAGLTAALLRAAAALLAITPYDRLPAGGRGWTGPLCARSVQLLRVPVPGVSLAALHAISAAFSNSSAVADAIDAVPKAGMATPAATDMLAALIAHCSSTPVSNEVDEVQLSARSASQAGTAQTTPGAHSASAIHAAILRAEVLVVMARAAKHRASLVLATWSTLCPLLLQCFSDASPAVRRAALQVIEELLHARAVSLMNAGLAAAAIGAALSSARGSGLHHAHHHHDGEGEGDDGDEEHGVHAAETEPASSSASEWSILEDAGDASSAPGHATLTIHNLMSVYLKAALRDVAPNVRTGAAMAYSYTLPADWLHLSTGVMQGAGQQAATSLNVDKLLLRDELLSMLASATFDPAPTVRVAASRVWGAFLAYPEWRASRPFSGFAGRVLLAAMLDDNVSVRAKASWALGNLGAPLATPAATAAALAQPARPAVSKDSTPLHHKLPGSAEIPDPAFTLYPVWGETLAAEAPLALLPPQCNGVQRLIEAAVDAAAVLEGSSPSGMRTESTAHVLAPLELAFPGSSPSMLVSLLGLPLLRVLTSSALRASSDGDKVACTAVRTLGYCIQGLLTHWLPLSPSLRELVNPVIVSGAWSNKDSLSNAGAVRADTQPCPDDALIKEAMLTLADIVAGADGASPAVAGQRGHRGPVVTSSSSKAGTGKSNAPLASQAWMDIGDDEDVREVIARRLEAPSLRRAAAGASPAQAEGMDGSTDVDEAQPSSTAAAGAPVPVVAAPAPDPVPPPSTSRFKFAAREGGGGSKGGGSGGAEGVASTGGATAAQTAPSSGKGWPGRDKDKNKPSQADTALSWRRGPATAPAAAPAAAPQQAKTTAPVVIAQADMAMQTTAANQDLPQREVAGMVAGKEKAAAASSSAISVKVRWNACHAVAQIIPLAHRCVMTHPEDHRQRDGTEGQGAHGSGNALMAAAAVLESSGTEPGGLVHVPGIGDRQVQALASVGVNSPSPPRPKVRKEVSSGSATMWAGVDHISTAHSPFLPKTLQGVVPPTSAGGGSATVPASPRTGTEDAAPPRHAPGTPDRSAPAASAAGVTVRHVVTDPTLPSVTIGVTWMPPVLAALQLALTHCNNFKVRIASAQALAAVPSRDAYRIPSMRPSRAPGAALVSATGAGGTHTHPSVHMVPALPSVSYASPALQRPGFDAYPAALMGLAEALACSETPVDFLEYRYKDQLKGSIRMALGRTILKAERADYGRMKVWFDGHSSGASQASVSEGHPVSSVVESYPGGAAALLFDWLCAEEGLLALASAGPESGLLAGMPNIADGTGMAVLGPIPAAAPGGAGGTLNVDEMPVRAASLPPFGVLSPHAGVDTSIVRGCWIKLLSLFKSRVKTLPTVDLLKKYEAKAAMWQTMQVPGGKEW